MCLKCVWFSLFIFFLFLDSDDVFDISDLESRLDLNSSEPIPTSSGDNNGAAKSTVPLFVGVAGTVPSQKGKEKKSHDGYCYTNDSEKKEQSTGDVTYALLAKGEPLNIQMADSRFLFATTTVQTMDDQKFCFLSMMQSQKQSKVNLFEISCQG